MSLLIALLVAVGLGAGARAARGYGVISEHAYNNRYNDASAARHDRVD
jgi:hypothetical protein